MSSGGVFQLLTNEGKADRLLSATALLNQRIQDISCLRRSMGKDPAPTLSDIEKTHVLFINAHFKPFAALGSEYNKVQPQSGSPQLGGEVQFSIPQFGDFFHDMVVRIVLTRTYGTPAALPSAGDTATVYGNIVSTYPTNGTDWNNAGTLTGSTYALVDAFGTNVVQGEERYTNMLRYVDYPAERLCSKVSFTVNNNPLDEYNWRVPGLLRKTMMSDEKLYGYKKLVGQEVPFEGFTGPRICPIVDTHFAPTQAPTHAASHGSDTAPVAGSAQNAGTSTAAYLTAPGHQGGNFHPGQHQFDPSQGVPATTDGVLQPVATGGVAFSGAATSTGIWPADAPVAHVQRGAIRGVDGPQTPKYMHHELELWNRLWFWFNLDARLSVPSVCIPYGQRFINVTLASADEIIQDFPGLYVEQTIASETGAVDANATFTRNYRPYWQNLPYTAPTIRTIEMYINNIFVNPEIHDLFISRVGFSLIRVYRQQTSTSNSSGEQQLLLSSLKWPVECIIFGFQPSWNASRTQNITYAHDWQVYGKPFSSVCELQQQAITGYDGGPQITTSSIGQIVKDTYQIDRPVVTTVALTAHGVPIFKDFPQAFFNTYVPFHFGGDAVRPPQDSGVMMMNFALFLGCYQPSGYINISRARELYLSWQGSYIDSSNPATVVAVAIALNFLLITDGSAVLRYTT